jgi:acylphosphatase
MKAVNGNVPVPTIPAAVRKTDATTRSLCITAIERVSHADDRVREARFWDSKSTAERVIAGWDLADSDPICPKDYDEDREQERRAVSIFVVLRAQGVEYAVAGSVAVNAHGFVRNTRDLEIFFRPTEDNAKAMLRALDTLGVPLECVNHIDLLTDQAQYKIHTGHDRIDLRTSIGEMPFEQVWRNHVDAEIDGVTVHFISKQDLIESKRQVGRLIDLAEIEQLTLLEVKI